MPGGGGIRLKYGNPMPIDDVAVDFPELPIIMAHPSFPWQDEAISICLHKPTVYIDLSGWSPKYFSPTLVQYANTLLKHKVLFGSDYPWITPDRWLADLRDDRDPRRGPAADPEGERGQAAVLMNTWRSDVIGSLLRPEGLMAARREVEQGRLSAAEFKRLEDRAVDEAIALQEAAGLDVVTDGELRRYAFYGHLVDASRASTSSAAGR